MPRLLGVDIPSNKKIEYALRYIYGVGPARARILIEEIGLDPNLRAHELNEEHLNRLMALIAEKKWVVEGDLRREISSNLKRMQAINCYRGIRHRRGLPVRGQRTQTNARTRKGTRRTVGVVRKAN
ncbi:MAG TPA: 30S ribosomal protein S13 [Opitutaceae bacterium]